MRLIKVKAFARRYFDPESQPDERTVHAWVASGKIPGRLINNVAYVDADAFEGSTGNALADRIERAA